MSIKRQLAEKAREQSRSAVEETVPNSQRIDGEAVTQSRDATGIEPFRPFPVDVLPAPVGEVVRCVAKAMGCDLSFVALPALVVLAGAIGNSRRIGLKQGWSEPAIVWHRWAASDG